MGSLGLCKGVSNPFSILESDGGAFLQLLAESFELGDELIQILGGFQGAGNGAGLCARW